MVANRRVLTSVYFIKIDMRNIIPQTVPQSVLINSIAQTLGLHDFYQVGLWNYCEGYGDRVTNCVAPEPLYWFDPVDIILNQLLAGATPTVSLPSSITDALTLVRIASHWMFGLFLTGACLSVPSIILTPLSVRTRWASLPLTILTFFTALTTTAASIIASAMFLIFKKVIQGVEDEINIQAEIGVKIRRDVATGRRRGNKKAYGLFRNGDEGGPPETGEEEKPKARRRWRSNR
ncbi:MAG: hypothetical protein Q9174_000442 [Haloplaca sp. 1 TL-2023]